MTKSGPGVVVLVGTEGRLLIADIWPAVRAGEASVLRSLARSELDELSPLAVWLMDWSPLPVIKSNEPPDCCWPSPCWFKYHWGDASGLPSCGPLQLG